MAQLGTPTCTKIVNMLGVLTTIPNSKIDNVCLKGASHDQFFCIEGTLLGFSRTTPQISLGVSKETQFGAPHSTWRVTVLAVNGGAFLSMELHRTLFKRIVVFVAHFHVALQISRAHRSVTKPAHHGEGSLLTWGSNSYFRFNEFL